MKSLILFTLVLCGFSAFAQNTFKLEGNQLVLPEIIQFETSSDRLKPQSSETLEYIKKYLLAKDYITLVRIEVHTDNEGNAADKQKLSEKRALAIARWLVDEGIDCKRLLAVGFGSTKPIDAHMTPNGRSQNNRVAIVNAALKGKPIGGMPVDGGGQVAGDACR